MTELYFPSDGRILYSDGKNDVSGWALVYHATHPVDRNGNWLDATREGYGAHGPNHEYFDIDTLNWKERQFTPEYEERLARQFEKQSGISNAKVSLH